MRQIQKGSVDRSVDLYIIDSTDGTPETGVAWNTAGIDLKYRRDLGAAVSVTEATLAALTTAHTDGGFLEIGNGVYRFDLPDAAWATGADHVTIFGTVPGMIVLPVTVQLVAYDPESALATPTNITAATGITLAAVTHTGAVIPTVSAVTGLTASNLDATVSSRMATYTQPSGFLAATFPTGTVANTTNITAATGIVLSGVTHTGAVIPTVTTLTGHTAQTGDAFARLGAPAGASVSADVAAVKTDTAAVKTKTDFLPSVTAGGTGGLFIAGTNAATTITTALTTTFTGNLTGSVGSVTGLTASNLDATISSRATPAQVNTEVVDALNVDTYAEPGQGAPGATVSLAAKINYLYKA